MYSLDVDGAGVIEEEDECFARNAERNNAISNSNIGLLCESPRANPSIQYTNALI